MKAQVGTVCIDNCDMCTSCDSVIPQLGTYSKEITKDAQNI